MWKPMREPEKHGAEKYYQAFIGNSIKPKAFVA
jgi:hypothetical protein